MVGNVRIKRVSVLGDKLRKQAKKAGLNENDLVLVTTTIHKDKPPTYKLEKVVGSPTDWLLERCEKVK